MAGGGLMGVWVRGSRRAPRALLTMTNTNARHPEQARRAVSKDAICGGWSFLTLASKNTDPPRGIIAAGPAYSSITRSKRAFPPRNAVRADLSGGLVPRAG